MEKKLNLLTISEIKLSLIKDKKIIFKNFEDFNIYLVNHSIKISILDYIKCIHLYFFNDVNINLLTDFLNYSKDDQLFNIDDKILIKYNLIKVTNEESLEQFIKLYNLILDKDYRIRKINNKSKSINKDYKFTSRTLKQCLLKTNTNYINYYLLLENCILHYTNYQTNLLNKLGCIQDIKLDNLIKNFEYQNEKINIVYSDIKNLNNQNKLLNSNINVTYKKVNDVLYQLNLQEMNENQNENQNENTKENTKVNTKFIKIINIFALYKINNNTLMYIDCNSKLFNNVERMSKLEFDSYCENVYKKEYNSKYINIISKIISKFKNDLDINKNIFTLYNNLTSKILVNYINEELVKFV
jgi:hypothetical protein